MLAQKQPTKLVCAYKRQEPHVCTRCRNQLTSALNRIYVRHYKEEALIFQVFCQLKFKIYIFRIEFCILGYGDRRAVHRA